MRLLLIRHGQSSNNHLVSSTGAATGRSPDPLLTELGHQQAKLLAQHVDALPHIDALYCSLMARTIQTAAPLADALDLPIIAHPDAFECGGPYQGGWEDRVPHPGTPRSVLSTYSPRIQLPKCATEDGWWTNPCETAADVDARATRLLTDLRTHHDDHCVALVIHGCFTSVLVNAAVTGSARFISANTGTTLLSIVDASPDSTTFTPISQGTRVCLEWLNRVDHLPAEMITGM